MMYFRSGLGIIWSFSCRDLERIEAPAYSVKAHDQIVNDIDGCGGLGIGGGAPELVTGSRDGENWGLGWGTRTCHWQPRW